MTHWFLCTWNNPPTDAWLQVCQKAQPDYVLGQKEIAPTTGTHHLQFVLYFKKSTHCNTLLKRFGTGIYCKSKAASAAEDILAYVTKEESRVADSRFEWGNRPRTCKSSNKGSEKFDETLDRLKAGELKDTLSEHQVKYFGNLIKLQAFYSTSADATNVRGLWISGPSGSGKSRLARRIAGETPFYAKPQSKWWDLYNGEKIVILDDLDINGSCLSHHLKIWLDRYAFVGEIKGGSIRPNYERFIITSQYSPEELWSDQAVVDAIRRRCEFRQLELEPLEPVPEFLEFIMPGFS